MGAQRVTNGAQQPERSNNELFALVQESMRVLEASLNRQEELHAASPTAADFERLNEAVRALTDTLNGRPGDASRPGLVIRVDRLETAKGTLAWADLWKVAGLSAGLIGLSFVVIEYIIKATG